MRPTRRYLSYTTLLVVCSLLCGCFSTKQIRIHNVSSHDFTDVSIAGQPYGDIATGAMTDYKPVRLKLRYAAMKLHVDGKYVTAQTLNFGASRYTYRIDVKDFEAGHLAIDLVGEKPPAGSD